MESTPLLYQLHTLFCLKLSHGVWFFPLLLLEAADLHVVLCAAVSHFESSLSVHAFISELFCVFVTDTARQISMSSLPNVACCVSDPPLSSGDDGGGERGLLHTWRGYSYSVTPERLPLPRPVLQVALGTRHGVLLVEGNLLGLSRCVWRMWRSKVGQILLYY